MMMVAHVLLCEVMGKCASKQQNIILTYYFLQLLIFRQ